MTNVMSCGFLNECGHINTKCNGALTSECDNTGLVLFLTEWGGETTVQPFGLNFLIECGLVSIS